MTKSILTIENGHEYWRHNGKLHRGDGPAVIWEAGKITWCWYGKAYTFDDWCSISSVSDKEKLRLKLKYAR